MDNVIGKNIARLRRDCGMTQEEMAAQLGLSFQAVSRWENGQTTPDVATLCRIAQLTQTSMDALVGYTHAPRTLSPYEAWYKSPGYYWGTEPSSLCLKIIELLPPVRPYRVLDIGCGEGKDAVFLARCGYDVTAFDIAPSGVEKAKRLAEQANVYIDAFCADVEDYRLDREFDILHCSGVLHYIRPHLREELFENYRTHTAKGGLHAMNAFVHKPFIAPPPEKETSYPWRSGELFAHYGDWYLEKCEERVFDCNSSGVPHQHAMDVVVARKME